MPVVLGVQPQALKHEKRTVRASDFAGADPELVKAICGFVHDPLGFVLFVFPWGQPGTDLADQDGPDIWQTQVLLAIGEASRSMETGALETAFRLAVASGHGIGKTALVAWIILWFIATRYAPQIIVTANTKNQLEGKTWREVSVWHKRSRLNAWFRWTATKFYLRGSRSDWFAHAIPWSENNHQAFAGAHDRHVLILFDEASTIAKIIWETAMGALTTVGAMMLAFGNPTENVGAFFDAFHKFRHRWKRMQVDSRRAKMTNKAELAAWHKDYGEDSDFFRIRVKGQFPRSSTNTLIGMDLVARAIRRQIQDYNGAPGWLDYPIIIGVDVARDGADQSVLLCRQGPKIHKIRKYRNLELDQLTSRVVEFFNEIKAELGYIPDKICIDAVGMGAGVADFLAQWGYPVHRVYSGEASSDERVYFNVRTEMWCRMKRWLETDGQLPSGPPNYETGTGYDQEMIDDLTTPLVRYAREMCQQLESKADIKKRQLPSPDSGDALGFTFTVQLPMQDRSRESRRQSFMETVLAELAADEHTRESWMGR